MKQFLRVAMLCAAAVLAACESDSGTILEIDATGELFGLVYVDRNANGRPDTQVDLPAEGVSVALLRPSSEEVVARATTDATGAYFFRSIPVGRYRLDVEQTSLGDTLSLASIDSATVTVVAGDTSTAVIALGFPEVPVAEVAALPVGRRIIVEGMALNAWTAFADSTVHIADTSGVLRAVQVRQAPILAGDTVRLLGTVVNDNGVNTIGDATAFRQGAGPVTRTPQEITTADAASADGGVLDNDLVRIRSASVINTEALPGGELRIAVDDGSGIVDVVLEPTAELSRLPAPIPGALMDVTGLLVARQGRTSWVLKPRVVADIIVSFQRVTVAEARALPVGRLVEIHGLALNGWVTFGDSTVHIVDPTGSLRATRVAASNIFASDSVRFVGRVGMRDGQVILTQVAPTVVLTNRTLPAPTVVDTRTASTANGGVLDAALVRVQNAVVADTASRANGDFVMRVNDGSGVLEVVIARSLGLSNSQFAPNATLNVTGLLVPAPGGASWQLKPRGQADITVTPAAAPRVRAGPKSQD